ncbi:unnamed protein product, partial [Lota lota]
FKVSEELVRVGVAQFSSSPQKEFYLNQFHTAEEDDVAQAAEVLRGMGIEIFVIGIGSVHRLELLKITADSNRLFTRAGSELLVTGYPKLRAALPEILNYVSTLKGLCCVQNTPIKPNIAFRLVGRNGGILYDFNFEQFSEAVVDKVMTLQMSEATSSTRPCSPPSRRSSRPSPGAGAK